MYATASYTSFTPLVSPPGPVGTYLTTGIDFDCSGVTTIVIPTTIAFSVLTYFLEFRFPEGDSNTGIYIAEVRFSDTSITVPTEVSSTPPLPPATTTVEQAASLSSTPSHFSTPPPSNASSSLSVMASTVVTLLHSLQLSSSSFYTFRTTSKNTVNPRGRTHTINFPIIAKVGSVLSAKQSAMSTTVLISLGDITRTSKLLASSI